MAARPKQGARAEPKADQQPAKADQKPQKGDQKPQKSDQKPQKADQKPKKQHIQRTDAEWRKIKLEYVAGKTTLQKLAQKYQVSESTIRKKASSQGWKKRKRQVGTKLEQKAIERLCDARAREFETIASVNDRMGDVLDYLLEFIAEQPPTKYDDLRGVESLTKAIAQVVMVKRDLYNMPSEEQKAKIEALREKSKLEREKWKDEKAQREAGLKEAQNTVFKVVIEGDTGGKALDA